MGASNIFAFVHVLVLVANRWIPLYIFTKHLTSFIRLVLGSSVVNGEVSLIKRPKTETCENLTEHSSQNDTSFTTRKEINMKT